MTKMRIAIMGASGRMGQALTRAVTDHAECVVAGGTEQPGSEHVGRDVAEIAGLEPAGALITDNPLELFTDIDAILDFTAPTASIEFAALAAQARIIHVIGTTGFDEAQLKKLDAASHHAVLVKAGNMSLGINLLTALVKQVATALDDDYDIEICEIHHKHKVDAPSGTALMLGEAAAQGRGVSLDDRAVRARDGHTGARRQGDIGFAALRGGSVVGDHSVMFVGDGERIELTHSAWDRQIYCNGAIKAALWGRGKAPGLYSMNDVLGL